MDKRTANILFAAWLAEQQPAVFNALARQAGAGSSQPMKLEGFLDTLRSIGSGITTAAKTVAGAVGSTVRSVGTFLGSQAGQATLSSAVQIYSQTHMPAAGVISAQYQRAQEGQAPADISMQWDPATQQYVPIGNTAALRQVNYTPWLMAGGAALLAILLIKTLRS